METGKFAVLGCQEDSQPRMIRKNIRSIEAKPEYLYDTYEEARAEADKISANCYLFTAVVLVGATFKPSM